MKNIQVAAKQWQRLPKKHKITIMSLAVLTVAVSLWRPTPPMVVSSDVSPERIEIDLEVEQTESLADQNSEPLGAQIDSFAPEFSAPKDELEEALSQDSEPTHSHVVAKGELLSTVFEQYGLRLNDMYSLINTDKAAERLRPGMTLNWTLNDEGRLKELRIERNAKQYDLYTLTDSGYEYQRLENTGELKPILINGQISGSFYQSAINAGLTPGQIATIVKSMQWKFDFGRRARKGDKFAVQLEQEFIDGKAVGRSEVKAMLYVNGGKEYSAVKFEDNRFYDASGQSLEQAFNRFPTNKRYRVSSRFNPHRKHPVTGRVSPHNGTDFATPIGTPIYATGDGKVVKARSHPLAGKYIVIKHGREYMTRYLHLHRILVKVGDNISRGQKIALSGNTGRSTGPHLHYEFIKNSRPVDPMKVQLPKASDVPSAKLPEFKENADGVMQILRDQI
ncbi:putative Cell wall endopeptidase, family M23 [Vibrio nigripulchritudo SOn1]|uniref:Cell wall endopeptidase, family M23 n=1 Tax=Vibrio nigripulchritudo SOn1 TaxID=1238450 RepID=A0AAV2VXG9_9VIBR|nr:murein DD-endopeptidase MepM [Vibrio nigripulchritudo]CCO49354.1 putative Cell wall endopeptidase, family M23 [Vibrio nigripulchritudo SOn1]